MTVYRSFTVRVPIELYLEVASLAEDEGRNINFKVNELLSLGIHNQQTLDASLRRMITAVTNTLENID